MIDPGLRHTVCIKNYDYRDIPVKHHTRVGGPALFRNVVDWLVFGTNLHSSERFVF